jgi:hypothetical protein
VNIEIRGSGFSAKSSDFLPPKWSKNAGYEVRSVAGSGLFSFYGRFHIKMFEKACLRGKEHFNQRWASVSFSGPLIANPLFFFLNR